MGKLGENALGPRIPVGQLWAGHSPGFIAAGLVGKNTLALFIWPTIKDHSSILHIHNHSMWPCAKTYRISRDHSRIILSNQNHPKFPFQNFFQFIVWLDSPIRLESSMFRFNKNSLAQGLRLADGALQFQPCSVWELLLPLQPVREEFGGTCAGGVWGDLWDQRISSYSKRCTATVKYICNLYTCIIIIFFLAISHHLL